MPDLLALLRDPPVLADGAWGTELLRRGLPAGAPPEVWNIERREAVLDVARDYASAGARILLTNTFGATRHRLRAAGLEERARELNRAGAAISREAAGDGIVVIGSMGPTGRLLLLDGASPAEVEDDFAAQAAALVEGGADALLVETMSDLAEAVHAVRAASGTGRPVVASMTFEAGAGGGRTMTGVGPEEAAAALAEAGAAAVGANCGIGIESAIGICRALRRACPRPIWIKANAGLPALERGQVVYRQGPADYARHVPALLDAGACAVGGCCGAGPGHIRAVGREIEAFRQSRRSSPPR